MSLVLHHVAGLLVGLSLCIWLVNPSIARNHETSSRLAPTSTEDVADQTTVRVVASADVTVAEGEPKALFGQSPTLFVDGGEDEDSYSFLRFDVTDVTRPITRAVVRLHTTEKSWAGTSDGPAIFAAEGDWSEEDLTWDDRPAMTSDGLDDASEIEPQSTVEFDVSAHVSANGSYSFALISTSSDGVQFFSREGTSPPELIVYVASAPQSAPVSDSSAEAVTIMAAGDIGCDPASNSFKGGAGTKSNCHAAATAQLIVQEQPDAVLMLGDMQYEYATQSNIEQSYEPTWGQFKEITYPTAGGSHDFYGTGDYYEYWGIRAGPSAEETWYSFDLGTWHLISLNGACSEPVVGGCTPGSAQYDWLAADLAANSRECTLAFWHQPRYSSGPRHGDDKDLDPLWDLLHSAGADLVLTAHDHDYERFDPIGANDELDLDHGMVEFVVGTGGKSLDTSTHDAHPLSRVLQGETYGVLRLLLRDGSYDWEFVAEAEQAFEDAGSSSCHSAPSATAPLGYVKSTVSTYPPGIGTAAGETFGYLQDRRAVWVWRDSFVTLFWQPARRYPGTFLPP
jgi:hypothetical protein